MGVSCQILINKPKGGHRPGGLVSGLVKYTVDKPLEVKKVTLSLVGKGHCIWHERKNKYTYVTYYGHEDYYTAFLDVIEKKEGDEVTTIAAGDYQFPFEFLLPDGIPPSYKTSQGRISYILRLTLERPGLFKFNKRFAAEVQVRSCVDTDDVPVVCGLEKTLTKPFSKRKHVVNLKVEIAKSSLTSGEQASLNLVLTNNTGVVITAIKTELIKYKTFTADCGNKRYVQSIVRGCTVESIGIPKNAIVNLTQEIPTSAEIYSVQNSKIINVAYKLRVTVRLPVPYINPSVEIPVLIGERVEKYLEEDPPSYWEVMREEEKVKE